MEGPAWNYWQTNGQPVEIGVGMWYVKFTGAGGPDVAGGFSDGQARFVDDVPGYERAGVCGDGEIYKTTFDADDSNAAGKVFEINLGEVEQSARVRVNGKDYAVARSSRRRSAWSWTI